MSKKQKIRRKDLKQPDVVISTTKSFFDTIAKHYKKVVAGVVGFLVLFLVVSLWIHFARQKALKASDSLEEALIIQTAFISTTKDEAPADTKKEKALPDFKTNEERIKAAHEKFQTVISTYSGADVRPMAELGLAVNELMQGNYDNAIKSMESFLAENEDSPLRPLVLENLGLASLQKGDKAKAKEYFTKLTDVDNIYYKVIGYQHLGDMLVSNDPAGARAQYLKIIDNKKYVTLMERYKYTHILDNINRKIDLLPIANAQNENKAPKEEQ